MQVTKTKWLKQLHPGDFVNATFSGVDDEISVIDGCLERITEDSITINKGLKGSTQSITYGLWQMLSLVCMERDISFVRENNPITELERLTLLLG